MVQSKDMSEILSPKHLFLEDDVLWSTGKDSWDMDWQEIQGNKVFPHRKIMTVENLEKEIKEYGLEIVKNEVHESEGNTSTYIAWLKV